MSILIKRLAGFLSAGTWGPSSAIPNERIPLIISDEEDTPSIVNSRSSTQGGDSSRSSQRHHQQQQLQQELRGLSAEYVNWFESTTAVKYAVGNFVAYLLVAVVGYSFVFEDWAVHDSVYFAMVVFTTVGMWHDHPDEARWR
jgi:hypothetical protein